VRRVRETPAKQQEAPKGGRSGRIDGRHTALQATDSKTGWAYSSPNRFWLASAVEEGKKRFLPLGAPAQGEAGCFETLKRGPVDPMDDCPGFLDTRSARRSWTEKWPSFLATGTQHRFVL